MLKSFVFLISSVVFGTSLVSQTAPPTEASSVRERPRLVVLLVVDQLAEPILDDAWPFLLPEAEGGFRRLAASGVRFGRCFFRHGCTFTGPGHATLSTGAPASAHGIVGNEWRDPESGARVYCVADAAPIVGVSNGGPGLGPKNLKTPTLGDAMKAHFGPSAQVVSLSWKDRSAILMGGQGADVAAWVDKNEGVFVSSTHYGSELPAWLTAFNLEHPVSRWFAIPWDRFGPEEAYAGLIDERKSETADFSGRRSLPRVVDGGLQAPGKNYYTNAYGSPVANEHLLEAAETALLSMKLGQDEIPDLLCVSFSANDVVGHACGPHSVEVRDMTLRVDALIARLLTRIDTTIGLDHTVVVLSADHGVLPIPEELGAARVSAGRANFVRDGAITAERELKARFGAPPALKEKPNEKMPRWILVYGDNDFYLNRTRLAEAGIDLDEARRVAARGALKAESVVAAFTQTELLAAYATQDPVRHAMTFAVHPDASGDVLLVPKRWWLPPALSGTTHGSPYPYDRHVPLFVAGPGIRALGSDQKYRGEVHPGHGVVMAARVLRIPDLPDAGLEVPPDTIK